MDATQNLEQVVSIARAAARKFAAQYGLDQDDCESEAMLAIAHAVRSHRAGDGASSPKNWCMRRVSGALLDHRRSVHGSRIRTARPAMRQIEQSSHKEDSRGLCWDQIHDTRRSDPPSLSEEYVAWLLRGLTPRERYTVKRIHVDGATMAEVGREVGVHESMVSCDLARAMAWLRYARQAESQS